MADYLDKDGLSYFWEKIKAIFATKQDTLVSGENIKTINNNSLLGSGNIDIQSGGGDVTDVEVDGVSVVDQDGVAEIDLTGKQDTLVSGTNIKTVNNQSLLGSGNIDIQSGNVWVGTCLTSYSTSAKVATTATGDFSLDTGNIVIVQFSSYSSVSPMTLNVDGTGAVALKEYGTTDLPARWWRTKGVVPFMYDGTNFVVVDGVTATSTYYGKTKLNTAINSTSTSESATPSAVKQAYDLANGKQDALVSGTNIKTVNNTSLLGSGNIDVEGVPHVNLTQAEYDALTPAQKDNGDIYFITDGDDTAYSGIIGSGELATDAKTLVGAINELASQFTTIRQTRYDVSVPQIASRSFTYINVPAPTTYEGEEIIGWRLIVHDPAHQATMGYFSTAWYLCVANLYSGTSGANTIEVHWVIKKVGL